MLEDLHWSDYSTVDLLLWLARRQESARLMVICTYRLTEIRVKNHPMQTVAHDLKVRGQAEELALPFLTENAVKKLSRQSPFRGKTSRETRQPATSAYRWESPFHAKCIGILDIARKINAGKWRLEPQ